MTHSLVTQLRFARSELQRALNNLPEADAEKRILPMNSISWIIGHLAQQEQQNWLTRLQDQTPIPHLTEHFGYGRPASTPPLSEVMTAWETVTSSSDPFLEQLTTADFEAPMFTDGDLPGFNVGTFMLRVIYHYWFHIGEILAIRQMLGHEELPDFVGPIYDKAPYLPDRTA